MVDWKSGRTKNGSSLQEEDRGDGYQIGLTLSFLSDAKSMDGSLHKEGIEQTKDPKKHRESLNGSVTNRDKRAVPD